MKSNVTARDVMTREYVGVSESDDLQSTVELMLEEDVGGVVVLRGSRPVGVLDERDVLRLVAGGTQPSDATVADAMQSTVASVAPDYGVGEAADVMSARGVRSLLVTDGDEPLGLLTGEDLLSAATLDRATSADEDAYREAAPLAAGADVGGRVATMEEQSICQECGRLSRGLREADGLLVCPDCRDI